MRRRALAISSADIWAKSRDFSTSRSEVVRRTDISRSTTSCGRSGRDGLIASSTRVSAGRGFSLPGLAGCDRRHLGDELLEEAAPPPEQPERRVEDETLFVAGHEHAVQGPVQVFAPGDPGDRHGRHRVEHGARADRHPGRPQRASEQRDVGGEATAQPLPGLSMRVENTFWATCQRPSTLRRLR